MLLLASRILEHELNDEGRLGLLEKLQEREFIPLIRSTRLNCYEQVLIDTKQVAAMEYLVAASANSDEHASYVNGDIFCFEDHIFFLLFGDGESGSAARMRAGVVYEPRTAEPLRKLNSFCQTINLCLADTGDQSPESVEDEAVVKLLPWRQDSAAIHQGFMRFVAKQDADSLSTIACRENARERVRASKLLEDNDARAFLRRAKEAYAEGYPVNPSSDDAATATFDFSVDKLLEAGLLRREVLVSCRKSGHTLFSLPSADALAVVTISQARCSVCGTGIADEKVEEVLAPTQFSSVLLEDGAWLVNRLHAILRNLGISESEIAVERPAGDGEARMVARVCGELFLIVMRDGDLTPAFARRAINTKLETESRHLLIVSTGTIYNEGRMSLQSFAKRLASGGNDFELIIADGASAAEVELRRAFERISQKALAEQLCELDASLGLSVPHLITTRFQMLSDTRRSDQIIRLPAPAEQEPRLQDAVQAVSVSDF
ncbi:MAG: hypothetical protein QOH25_191 [Acidobacteriota bacterium]|jgi:hypothetical protein|nr:hypothetical protein [Acidobacteriota bacterium]